MKHPTRDTPDHMNRRDAADEATIIIGATDTSQETVIAPHTTPEPAPMVKSIPPDSGHTRILRPMGVQEDIRSDPVVGWLVILSGPGKGNFRPIFSGSNTIGRSSNQRIPIDFGDDAISSEKQAFLVYDGRKRQYLADGSIVRAHATAPCRHTGRSAMARSMSARRGKGPTAP